MSAEPTSGAGDRRHHLGGALDYGESELADGSKLVTLGGALDILSADAQLEELLTRCVEAGSHLVLDISRVDFIDSAGLALLVATDRKLSASDRRLVLLRPPASVRRVLTITGLDRRLAVVDSAQEAEILLGRPSGLA